MESETLTPEVARWTVTKRPTQDQLDRQCYLKKLDRFKIYFHLRNGLALWKRR